MRNILLIGTVLLISFSTSCKRDSDVVGTYKDGEITRGTFYAWMKARRYNIDAILKKKNQQSNRLRQMALERIIAREAKKAEYDKTDDFKYLKHIAKRNFYMAYMVKKMREDVSFKEEVARVKIIKLLVKQHRVENNRRIKLPEEEIAAAMEQKLNLAKSIIKKLDEGESFEELAKKYSDDFSKRKGGDIGFVTQGMRGAEFSKAVFTLKGNQYTSQPVQVGNAYYIIKVDERVELNNDNIDNIIEDKRQREGLKKRIMIGSARNYQNRLMNATDVVFNVAEANNPDPNTVIFKIGNLEYKVADLNKRIAYQQNVADKMGRKKRQFSKQDKDKLVNMIFREELLKREALKQGVDKDPKFIEEYGFFSNFILASSYQRDNVLSGITVTPVEVKKFYDDNRDRMYTRTENKGGQKVKTVIPFTKVSDRIEYMLLNRKSAAKRKEWEAEILKKNNFVVNESELEGE